MILDFYGETGTLSFIYIVYYSRMWAHQQKGRDPLRTASHDCARERKSQQKSVLYNYIQPQCIYIASNYVFLFTSTTEGGERLCFHTCLSVCLSVSRISQKVVDGFVRN